MTPIRTTVLAACAAVALFCASARADSTPAADFELGFTTTTAADSTGLNLHIHFKNPSDPSADPSPQRRVAVQLPPGARIDGSAAPTCTASDAELLAFGEDACRVDTKIGSGVIDLATGGGAPFDPWIVDAAIFNAPGEWAELATKKGGIADGSRPGTGRRKLTDERTLVEEPQPVPGGPPDFESAVKDIKYALPARVTGGHRLFTTPSSCPPDGRWLSTLSFTTADGNSYTATSATPCAAPRRPRRHRHKRVHRRMHRPAHRAAY